MERLGGHPSLALLQGFRYCTRACYFGIFKGDIDIDEDVDMDSYFGIFNGGFKVSLGIVRAIEVVMVLILTILK